ncbi:MAG: hypothetical protein KBD10_00120 [Candidatus Pacebacteria bacterium]|nr:hypothetical protein [Candidatus Paceibacterota bacterium]
MENSKPNMRSLVNACENLGISYKKIDKIGNLLALNIDGNDFYFTNTRVPLNNEPVAAICVSKVYAYWLLNSELPMPKTKSYLDPNSEDEEISKIAHFKNEESIVDDILENFELPVVVKMNSGSQGRHVYKCKTKNKVALAVKSIYKKKQKDYDSTMLAQEFIEIKNEYRAILLGGEVILLYEKVSNQKITNLSPLHNDDGKAELVTDENIKNSIVEVVNRSPVLKSFEWIGLDIAKDKNNEWWILELNTRPGFSYFIRDNGDEKIVEMYEKLLNRIKNGKK